MQRWIVSPAFDLAVFSGSALVVLAAWAGHSWDAVSATTIVIAVAVLSNGPHLAATWTRAWLDARERTERPVAYLAVPFLILCTVLRVGTSGTWGFRLLMSVVIVWAAWHFAAQCYGLLRIYQKKSGEAPRLAHRFEAWFIFAVGLAGLIWRLHFGPTRIGGYRVLLPEPPLAAVIVVLAVVLGLGVALVADRLRPGTPLGAPRLVFLASVVVGFWVPFMVIQHGSAAFAAAAGWHGLQYLGVVWMFNVRKHGGKPLVPGARLIGWVSQPGRAWAFMGLLWALALSVYAVVWVVSAAIGAEFARVAALTWIGLTLGHYWLDGLIWKMREPAVAAHLT